MFSDGCSEQKDKIGPGRMLEILKTHHPGKLYFPSETEIRSRISKLVTKYKKHGTIYIVKGIQEPLRGYIEKTFQ